MKRLLLILLLLAMAPAWAQMPLRLGIQAHNSKEQTVAQWQAFAHYLETALGQPVELTAYELPELESALTRNTVDFLLASPGAFILLKQHYSLSAPLATLVRQAGDTKLEAYGGVIFTRSDAANINHLADLPGRSIALPAAAFSSFQMQAFEMLDAGLAIPDVSQLHPTGLPIEKTVTAVLDGQAELGFVRTGVLEAMALAGKVDLRRIKVINGQKLANFPYRCSTRLYPEWPMVAMPHVDQAVARRLTVALLSLPADSGAAKSAGLYGFTTPADYSGVESMMRQLRVRPFETVAEVSLADLWHQYAFWIVALAALVMLLLVAGAALVVQNRRVRQGQQRFATLFEFSPEPMWIIAERRFIDCNMAAVRMLGYPNKAAILNRSPAELSPARQPGGEESNAKAQRHFDALTQYGPQRFEWVHCKADGSEFTADVSLTLCSLDGRQVVLCSWYDISERKLAEHALHQSQEMLRHLANQVPGALYQYRMSRDGRVVFPYASDGFYDLYEITPEQLRQNSAITRQRWHPEDSEEMQASIFESARSLQPWIHEYRLVLPEKGVKWVLGRARPEAQADGSILWHGFIADISESKKIAQELENYRYHLEDLLVERTTDLVAARDAAESASRAKSTFLANMSHELRTPLNAIIGMTDLAQRRASDPKQRDQLTKVRHASRHLLSIINDILDLSKIEAERLNLEQVEFKLGSLLENLNSMMGERAKEKHLALIIDATPALMQLTILGDPLRLAQILLNLTGNAIKFTAAGSITVRAMVEEQSATDALLRFEVQDTGLGITAQDQLRLFTAFEQADSSTTRQYGGTGLGLAISKRLAQLMGGSIGVLSQPGAGSTFWFTARLQTVEQSQAMPAAQLGHSSQQQVKSRHAGARVLLAEDEPINQEISQEILEEVGLQVDVASDGAQAVTMAERTDYDLILMDIQMPRLNGIDAAQAIRALPNRQHTIIVAMTANAFDEDRQRCLAAGMNDHIAKPVDPDRLFDTLLKWLPPGQ